MSDCVSFEMAKALKEAGYPQAKDKYNIEWENEMVYSTERYKKEPLHKNSYVLGSYLSYDYLISAPCGCEILKKLPAVVRSNYSLQIQKDVVGGSPKERIVWIVEYVDYSKCETVWELCSLQSLKSLSEACAMMYIWLVENKIKWKKK